MAAKLKPTRKFLNLEKEHEKNSSLNFTAFTKRNCNNL